MLTTPSNQGATMSVDAVDLTTHRGQTHGDWKEQATLARTLKECIHHSMGWTRMDASQQEALEMIMVKVSRICTGNPEFDDHWDDIMGYAHLGKAGHVHTE